MSYIIDNNGKLVAKLDNGRKMESGEQVKYAWHTTSNALNANRDKELVNAQVGKISNAKKYEKAYKYLYDIAVEINENEFQIL